MLQKYIRALMHGRKIQIDFNERAWKTKKSEH